MRKIVSFLMIAIFLMAPVSAASSSSSDVEYVQKSSFWNWFAGKPGTGWNKFVGYTFGNSCPNSEDGYHHASSYERPIGNWTVESGYYKCICDLCGAEFKAYEKDLQQSYDAQVEDIRQDYGTTEFGLKGFILPLPIVSFSCDGGIVLEHSSFGCPFSASFFNRSVAVSYCGLSLCPDTSIVAPVSGTYFLCFEGECSGVMYPISPRTDGVVKIKGDSLYNFYYTTSGRPCYVALLAPSKTAIGCTVSGRFYYLIEPVVYDIVDYVGGVDSRPTSITGDYGIIGDNGQIIKVEGDKIVNETNNTYTNPSTGVTDTITDWSYDYSTRTYTLTLGGGTTTTVTYGDENVVIKEGDTTYNVYYLVDGSGSENPDPGPDVPPACDHTWTETGRTEPTCTTAGKVTSTCSKCNQTKTETIPATGHTWVVDRTVQTTYDEEGNLLQQGYTIYSCSVCGEQYKDMEGTGPPGQEEEKSIWEKIGDFFGTIGGGFIDIIGAVAGKLLDALIALAEMMMDKLKTVVETVLSIFDEVPALFGGFLDFLAAIFPFLPPEITTILTFGVIAITFIGILKAVRR